jgi:hypothetical protein
MEVKSIGLRLWIDGTASPLDGNLQTFITFKILALYCFHDDIQNAAGPRPPADTNDLIGGFVVKHPVDSGYHIQFAWIVDIGRICPG